jgi:hypothetical protein
MKMRVLFVLCAALALAVGVATATAGTGHGNGHGGKGGNSANAKLCQKGGWKILRAGGPDAVQNQRGVCVLSGLIGGTFLWSCHGPNVAAASGTLSRGGATAAPTTSPAAVASVRWPTSR